MHDWQRTCWMYSLPQAAGSPTRQRCWGCRIRTCRTSSRPSTRCSPPHHASARPTTCHRSRPSGRLDGMLVRFLIVGVSIVCFSFSFVNAADVDMSTLRKDHPRLFLPDLNLPQLKEAMTTNPQLADLHE